MVACINILLGKNGRTPAPPTGLSAVVTGENKILQINSKWSETRKKHEISDAEFFAGRRCRQPAVDRFSL